MGSFLTVSVVSHNQLGLVEQFLDDMSTHCPTVDEVIVTTNAGEPFDLVVEGLPFSLRLIENAEPKGFGANHNAAFAQATSRYFCVANPDIRLVSDPFPALVAALDDEAVGAAGPRVVDPVGEPEDSGRRFPTVQSLLLKFWRQRILRRRGAPDFVPRGDPVYPDWIGGMFMVFRSKTFQAIGGFDERYFLYYEDVDLCWRLRRAGWSVALEPEASVIHGAQRTSWKSWRYMRWHLTSMARFLLTQAAGDLNERIGRLRRHLADSHARRR